MGCQVTAELIDTTRATPSFIQVDAAGRLGRRAGLWGQTQTTCAPRGGQCNTDQDCCGGLKGLK